MDKQKGVIYTYNIPPSPQKKNVLRTLIQLSPLTYL